LQLYFIFPPCQSFFPARKSAGACNETVAAELMFCNRMEEKVAQAP
jgi:hypothetical protein